jgi:hypothetical protein
MSTRAGLQCAIWPRIYLSGGGCRLFLPSHRCGEESEAVGALKGGHGRLLRAHQHARQRRGCQ